MANPKGNLSGFSDPSTPGWEQRAVEKVNTSQERKRKRAGTFSPLRRSRIDIACAVEFVNLVREAASRREMSIVSYARRAIAAFVAHDLDLPFAGVVAYVPAVRANGIGFDGEPRPATAPDDGRGHGPWVIGELR